MQSPSPAGRPHDYGKAWGLSMGTITRIIALSLTAGLASGCSDKPEPRPRGTTIAVSATGLFSAFASNSVSAERRYGGHVIKVTGEVESVDAVSGAVAMVRLASGNNARPVMATIEVATDRAIDGLAKGADVTLLCLDISHMDEAVELKSCSIVAA